MKVIVCLSIIALATAAKDGGVTKGKGIQKIPTLNEGSTAQLPSASITKTNSKNTANAPAGILPPLQNQQAHPAVSKTIITTYIATPLADNSQTSNSTLRASSQQPVRTVTFHNQVLHPAQGQYVVPATAVVPGPSPPVIPTHPLPAAPAVVARYPAPAGPHGPSYPALGANHGFAAAPSINYGHYAAPTIGHRVVAAPPIGYNYLFGFPHGFVIPTPNYASHSNDHAQYH